MHQSGPSAIPQLAGTPFLEKPPLTYWLANTAPFIRLTWSCVPAGWATVWVAEGMVEADGQSIEIVTVHSSKGLEWDHVWIARTEENIVPDAKSTEPEERRLFYVAMTRARQSLMISGTAKNFASRFATEAQVCPAEALA